MPLKLQKEFITPSDFATYKYKTKETTLPYRSYLAFLLVDFEPQLSVEEPSNTGHHTGTGTEIFTDKPKHALIFYPAGYSHHQDIMIHFIEKFRQIGINSYRIALPYELFYLPDTIMGRSTRSEAAT